MAHLDDEVRHALLERGDDGKAPRHAMFYFYGSDIAALERTARAEDFSVQRMSEHDGLILEKTLSVDEVSFAPVAALLESWAIQFRAEYDGWECELIGGG